VFLSQNFKCFKAIIFTEISIVNQSGFAYNISKASTRLYVYAQISSKHLLAAVYIVLCVCIY